MNEDHSNSTLSNGTERTIGREAQRNNILAARVISDIVKTTLGPKGMDKMLVDAEGNITITNDGVTILEEMEIEHPAAKMLVDIAKTQESEVGDGTTTVALLAGKLLERAESLLEKKIHPTVIIEGYRKSAKKSIEFLEEMSSNVKDREMLKRIAMTAMTGKGAEGSKEKLSEIVVNAIDMISEGKEIDLDGIKIEKISGESVENSELIRGVVLNKERASREMPQKIVNAKILLIDFPIEVRNPEIETRVSISSPEQLESFILSEERAIKDMAEKVIKSGANALFSQKGIDDSAQHYLAKQGIMAFRRVSKSDMEKIAKATGGKIISSMGEINPVEMGGAGIIEEKLVGEESITYITECSNPKSATIIVRGGSSHFSDEIERAVRDSMGDVASAVKVGKVLGGGGAPEIELSRRIKEYSKTIGGRERLAVEEFANALESIPETLAENAGLDSIDTLAELKKNHESGRIRDGLNLFNNKVEDTLEAGIIEPLKVKVQAISSASEVAVMILRIDDVLISRGKKIKEEKYEEE